MAVTRSSPNMVLLLLFFLSILQGLTTTAANMSPFWQRHLPNVPMPSSLHSLLSPLSAAQTNRFAKHAQNGTLANDAPAFCTAAQAMCSKDIPVMRALDTGTWSGRGNADVDQQLDPESTTYFHEKDLFPGAKVILNLHNLYPMRSFLPRSIADALPFSSNRLPEILQVFDIPWESGMVTNMRHTLGDCEMPEANGEIKACATSMESLLDFVTGLLGSDLKIMQTMDASGKAQRQSLTVVGVPTYRPAKAKSVACHNEMYPYMLYYCHQIHDTKVFEVNLQAEDGKVSRGIATCHVNTAKWNPKHVAFKVLNAQPGHTDICHFISESDLVWVPSK